MSNSSLTTAGSSASDPSKLGKKKVVVMPIPIKVKEEEPVQPTKEQPVVMSKMFDAKLDAWSSSDDDNPVV